MEKHEFDLDEANGEFPGLSSVGPYTRVGVVLGVLMLLGVVLWMTSPALERVHIPMAGIGTAFFIAILTDVFNFSGYIHIQGMAWVAAAAMTFGVILGMMA